MNIFYRVVLAIFLAVLNAQLSFASIDFVLTSGDSATGTQSLANDSNNCPTDGPMAAYVAGTLTNSGATTVSGIEAELSALSGGFSLTGAQISIIPVGTMAAGGSIMVGWHITYPCDTSKKNKPGPSVSPTVTVTTGGGAVYTQTLTLSSRKAISANAGGNITSTTLGAGAIVGQTIEADVLFDFGGNSAGDEFFTQPAGNTDFDAACLQLIGTEVTSSNVTAAQVGTVNTLYFVSPGSQSGNGYFIGVKFFYKYLCASTTSTARPYAVQTSGNTNIKYTGNYDATGGGIVFDFPTSINPFTITKTATPNTFSSGSGPYTATYTVTLTNPSAFDAIIEGFTDTLPSGVSFQGFTVASDVNAANSGAYPSVGDTGTLSFVGFSGTGYEILAGATLTLIYDTEIHDVDGTYVNTAAANIGTTVLGTATASIIVGGAELNASKAVSIYDPASLGLYAVPGNDVVYTFTITNIGSGDADAGTIILKDSFPTDIEFYNGDFDAANVGMGPFEVSTGSSGVTCCAAVGEVEYSSSVIAPIIYGYSPSAGYDENVKHIKFTPSNAFQGGGTLTISFRVRIK